MNKNDIKLAIDFDGCLGKTSDIICNLINFRTGSNHTYKEIDRWTYWDDIGKGKDFWESYDYLDKNKNARLQIQPYDNNVFYALIELDLEFDIVTANNKEAAAEIEKWMNLHGELGEFNDLYFEVNCIGRKTSAEKLDLDYNIYIDDNPGLALEAANYPNKIIALANAPWNKHIKDTNNVRRFESWKEVPDLINKLLNK